MKLKKTIALLLCVAMTLGTALAFAEEAAPAPVTENVTAEATATEKEPILTDGEMAKILIQQCANLILLSHKGDSTREELYEATLMEIMKEHPELIEDAYRAMFSQLDEHSVYYTEEEYNYFLEDMAGEFVGIGVLINQLSEGLLVSGVTKESPAGAAGIMQGDIIVSADGVSLVGMEIAQARTYITGPLDTVVKIGIIRNGVPMEFDVVRKPIILESGRYQVVEGNIGFIQLDSFDDTSPLIINEALDYFDSKGITDIIFDLRYNLGGGVNALTEICQRVIPAGPIIHFEYKRESQNNTIYSSCQDPKYKLVVLVNDYSASASEAFSGAVQDSGVGIVIGTTTFGKGSMQTLTNFRVGGGVKLTVAEYLTRDKRHIDGIGIKPDYYVEDTLIKMNKAGFESFDFTTKPKLGDKGTNVLALNQRLYAMGYDVGIPTDEFTAKTKNAVFSFQASQEGLYPYGVCDIATQLAMEKLMQGISFSDNATYKTAVDIIKSGSLEKYEASLESK